MMANVESILYEKSFFADTAKTPKEGVEHHRKQKCLKNAISKGKVYLLGAKKQGRHESVEIGS